MTIKEFSKLCGCNPQTLRYYDHVELLKPAQVGSQSGYRYYSKEQALTFVKIKNLQRAGFAIEEIRELLDKDDSVVVRAFDAKIAEAEKKLQEIMTIRRTYQTEMTTMNDTITMLRERIAESLSNYDAETEFGIDRAALDDIAAKEDAFFAQMLTSEYESRINFEDITDSAAAPDYVNDPAYSLVCEKRGWQHFKDISDELPALENGAEYALMFLLDGKRIKDDAAFAGVALNLLLMANEGIKTDLSCNIAESPDGINSFRMFRRVSGD